MPMIMNQYGWSRTAGAITGFINLFNPIGVSFTILFFVGVCGNMFSSNTRKKCGFLGLFGIVIAEVYTYFTAYNYGSGQPIDMEKARRYPPDKEKLAKIAEALELTEDEANTMYDYAALAKDNSVSPDLPEYIMETDNVRVALRKARDLGMGDKDWMDVIKMLEEKEKEAKK